MKIDAKVKIAGTAAEKAADIYARVLVDIDYVEPDVDSINEYVRTELEERYGFSFCDDDFTVTNIDEIIEEVNYKQMADDKQIAS